MPVRSGLRKRRNFTFFLRKSLFLYQDPRRPPSDSFSFCRCPRFFLEDMVAWDLIQPYVPGFGHGRLGRFCIWCRGKTRQPFYVRVITCPL